MVWPLVTAKLATGLRRGGFISAGVVAANAALFGVLAGAAVVTHHGLLSLGAVVVPAVMMLAPLAAWVIHARFRSRRWSLALVAVVWMVLLTTPAFVLSVLGLASCLAVVASTALRRLSHGP